MLKYIFVLLFPISGFAAPNPASVFCKEKGGTLKSGMNGCYFGEQSGVGEWTLYRHAKGSKQTAVEAYFGRINNSRQPANSSATAHCESVGGKFELETQPDGYAPRVNTPDPVCRFKDGSTIDAEALLRGSRHPSNVELTKILSQP